MRLRRMVDRSKQNQPEKPERARRDERVPPASRHLQNGKHERRRDRAANGRSAVEQGDGPSGFAPRKPLRDSLGGARPVRRLRQTQEESEERKASQPDR